MCGFAASNNQLYGAGQTELGQEQYYKLVYAIAEASINDGDVLRGIALWRWDAVDSGSLSSKDEALNLSMLPCMPLSDHQIHMGKSTCQGLF